MIILSFQFFLTGAIGCCIKSRGCTVSIISMPRIIHIHGLLLVWKSPEWVANFVFTLNFWSPFHRATYFFWEFCCFMVFLKVCSEVYQYMVCSPPLEPFKSVIWDLGAFSQCHALFSSKRCFVGCGNTLFYRPYAFGVFIVFGVGYWVLKLEDTLNIVSAELALLAIPLTSKSLYFKFWDFPDCFASLCPK